MWTVPSSMTSILTPVCFDDGLDFLAARADEVADLVRGDAQLEQARGVGRNGFAMRAEGFLHGVENLEAGLS